MNTRLYIEENDNFYMPIFIFLNPSRCNCIKRKTFHHLDRNTSKVAGLAPGQLRFD